jgi:tRNA 2-selenouridine synthase SelU
VLFFNQLNCQNIFKINLCRLWRSRITKGGATVVCQYWLRSLEKIQKRLGLERYNALLKLVNNALSTYKEQGDHKDFYPVVEELLGFGLYAIWDM